MFGSGMRAFRYLMTQTGSEVRGPITRITLLLDRPYRTVTSSGKRKTVTGRRLTYGDIKKLKIGKPNTS